MSDQSFIKSLKYFIIAWKLPFNVLHRFLFLSLQFTKDSMYTKANIAPKEVELLLWLFLACKLLHTCRLFYWIVFSLFVNGILLWDSVNSSFLIFADLPKPRNTSFANFLCLKNLFSSIIRIKAWKSLLLLSAVLFSCFFCFNWMFL